MVAADWAADALSAGLVDEYNRLFSSSQTEELHIERAHLLG
jgi:hypothetical protein